MYKYASLSFNMIEQLLRKKKVTKVRLRKNKILRF